MAFKKSSHLMRHDAAGAAAFWARYYLERENWEVSSQPEALRMKVDGEDRKDETVEAFGDDDTWPPHP